MRTLWAFVVSLPCVAACQVFGMADFRPRLVPNGQGALAVYRPELVAPAQTPEVFPGPDGPFIAIVRQAPPTLPRSELALAGSPVGPSAVWIDVCNLETRTRWEALRIPEGEAVHKVQLGSNGLTVVLTRPERAGVEASVSRLDPARRRVTKMHGWNPDPLGFGSRLHISPTTGAIVVTSHRPRKADGTDYPEGWHTEFRVIRPDGTVQHDNLGSPGSSPTDFAWTADGKRLVCANQLYVPNGAGQDMTLRQTVVGIFDPTGFTYTPTNRPVPTFLSPGQDAQFTVKWVGNPPAGWPPDCYLVANGGDRDGIPLRIGPATTSIVGGRYVVWCSYGYVFSIRVDELSPAAYAVAVDARTQYDAMIRAKEIGRRLFVLAERNQGRLPAKDQWQEALSGIGLRSKDVEGFVYFMDGHSVYDMEQPHKTPVGAVETRKGRAVAYADGTVRWERRSG
jgi:hypothetical protein